MIIVKPVLTKHDLRLFTEFPNKLFRKEKAYVPALSIDEMHVFDQKKNNWYTWNKLEWIERKKGDEPVISHLHFTGTGTRFLEENVRKAIKELFTRSFS